MKILNLTEGSFPINLSYKLESIDVPKIGSLIGNLEVKLRILRISNNLLKCDGSIKGDFTDICQNCLKETVLNIFSEIDVTLKDLNEIHSDSSEQDQTHYQDLEYFSGLHGHLGSRVLHFPQPRLPFQLLHDLTHRAFSGLPGQK